MLIGPVYAGAAVSALVRGQPLQPEAPSGLPEDGREGLVLVSKDLLVQWPHPLAQPRPCRLM